MMMIIMSSSSSSSTPFTERWIHTEHDSPSITTMSTTTVQPHLSSELSSPAVCNKAEAERTKKIKQKALRMWTVEEVLKWLRKHIGEGYYIAYSTMFRKHQITGRTVIRLTDFKLQRMGMENQLHRNELLSKIASLILKSELVEFKDKAS